MAGDASETFAQLKYVLFSWPNTPLLKKDGLAKAWFKSHATMETFATAVGGFPLTMYEAALPATPAGVPELFLPRSSCEALVASLAHEMGPSRAQASWKATAWHTRAALTKGSHHIGGVKVHRFQSQAQLEDRFAQLKDANDWVATRQHWKELKRAQEVWARLVYGVRSGELQQATVVSVDFETWEADHDAITEVGVTTLRIKPPGAFEEQPEHFVVAENAQHRNGRYCPDARDNFQFGTSSTLPTASLSAYLQRLLRQPPPSRAQTSDGSVPSHPPSAPPGLLPPSEPGPVLLLLHDPRGDLISLAQLSLQMNLFERTLPPPSSPAFSRPSLSSPSDPPPSLFLLDTQRLYSGWSRRKKQARLEDACAAVGVDADGRPLVPHNAGNDAFATLRLFVRLMAMDIGGSADEIPASMLASPAGTRVA
ncbi:hypothetical protein JCM11641_005250 [Rhodosporidiobolus odoratus]